MRFFWKAKCRHIPYHVLPIDMIESLAKGQEEMLCVVVLQPLAFPSSIFLKPKALYDQDHSYFKVTQQPSYRKNEARKERETLFCPKSVAFWRRWKPCLPWSNISPLVLLLLLLLRLLLFPKAFWPRKIILKALCLKAKTNVCKVRFSSVRLHCSSANVHDQ